MLPTISGEFRAAADPDLRFAPSGVAVGKVRAVASSRKKEGDAWVDDRTLWVNVVCFNALAENVAESIAKGDLFIVEGRVQTDEWQDKEGNNRTTVEIVADRIGPSLAYATAKVSKVDKRGAAPQQRQTTPADRGAAAGHDAWASVGSDDPPF